MPAGKKNKRMRDMGLAFAIVLAIPVLSSGAVLAVFFLSSRDDDTGLSAQCDDAAPVEKLSNADVGQFVLAKGRVVGSRKIDEGLLLDLGENLPARKLSVLIRNSSIENWTMAPELQYGDRDVALAGKLERVGGSLRLEARSPADLAVCP